MHRISVIGTSCAGKSTFAARLAAKVGLPHVELDALHWEKGWIEAPAQVMRSRVSAATAQGGWIVDGNYSVVRDIVWPSADTIIWLDYSFSRVMWRAIRRTFRRVCLGEPCCNGNRESLRQTLGRDSILLWVVQTHGRKRREYRKLLPEAAGRGTTVIVLRSPKEADRWLGEARAPECTASRENAA